VHQPLTVVEAVPQTHRDWRRCWNCSGNGWLQDGPALGKVATPVSVVDADTLLLQGATSGVLEEERVERSAAAETGQPGGWEGPATPAPVWRQRPQLDERYHMPR